MIKDGIIKQSDRQWMRGILRQQEYLTVENWNNNIFDFSLHYFVDAAGTLHYKGSVSFDTNEKGAYEGNNLSLFTKETDKSIREFLSDKITLLAETLKKAISNTDIVRNYRGYLGVDMYVYLEDGEYKVFPCVEINLRYNMGTLALALGSRLKHKDGKVFTLRISDRNAVEYADRMREKYPVHLSEGLLSKGFVPLIPLSEDTSFITALHLY